MGSVLLQMTLMIYGTILADCHRLDWMALLCDRASQLNLVVSDAHNFYLRLDHTEIWTTGHMHKTFETVAPLLWNTLLVAIKCSRILSAFKKTLPGGMLLKFYHLMPLSGL